MRADAARIDLGRSELQADDRLARVRGVEQVQVEEPRKILAHAEAADAVAVGVERRREHADAQLAGQHRDHAAGHAALGRHAHAVKPFAGIVIHAARPHHAEDALDVFAAEGLPPGERVDAVIGQRRRHHRQVAAGDRDRALLEIQIDHRVGRLGQDVEIAQHVADGAVAMAGLALRTVDRLHPSQTSSPA